MQEPPNLPLDITKHESPGTVTLALEGELDLSTAPLLDNAIGSVAASVSVVLDLNELSFMDSSGMKVLLEIAQDFAAEERTLTIQRSRGEVKRLMEITGLNDLLPLRDWSTAVADDN